jgi:DNA-binding CsgD family transcriptional regulator
MSGATDESDRMLGEVLTRRERDILATLAQSHNEPEIAENLILRLATSSSTPSTFTLN